MTRTHARALAAAAGLVLATSSALALWMSR